MWDCITKQSIQNPLFYCARHAYILSDILRLYEINVAYCSIKLLYRSCSHVYSIGLYYRDEDNRLCVCNDRTMTFLMIKVIDNSCQEVGILDHLRETDVID